MVIHRTAECNMQNRRTHHTHGSGGVCISEQCAGERLSDFGARFSMKWFFQFFLNQNSPSKPILIELFYFVLASVIRFALPSSMRWRRRPVIMWSFWPGNSWQQWADTVQNARALWPWVSVYIRWPVAPTACEWINDKVFCCVYDHYRWFDALTAT